MSDLRSLLLADPWQVREEDFPHAGSPADKLAFLLNYAVLAPSILNSQPWRFRLEGDRLLMSADKRRKLPVTDGRGRELVVSCGAALANLRLAARGVHHRAEVDLLPRPGEADVLAEVALAPAAGPSAPEREAFEAITHRRTVRSGFEDRQVTRRLIDRLVAAAGQHGATLHLGRDASARQRIRELVAEGERQQLSTAAYREELARWISDRRSEGQMPAREAEWRVGDDGAGPAGQTPDLRAQTDLFTPMAAQIARTFGSPRREAAAGADEARTGPIPALLATARDGRADWLGAGEALQMVLLRAAAQGVAASYLSPPLEVAALRQSVAEAFGAEGRPQVLLQLGYAAEGPPAARRAVGEVLD